MSSDVKLGPINSFVQSLSYLSYSRSLLSNDTIYHIRETISEGASDFLNDVVGSCDGAASVYVGANKSGLFSRSGGPLEYKLGFNASLFCCL